MTNDLINSESWDIAMQEALDVLPLSRYAEPYSHFSKYSRDRSIVVKIGHLFQGVSVGCNETKLGATAYAITKLVADSLNLEMLCVEYGTVKTFNPVQNDVNRLALGRKDATPDDIRYVMDAYFMTGEKILKANSGYLSYRVPNISK